MTQRVCLAALLLSLLLFTACNTASYFGNVEQGGLSNEVGVLTYGQAVTRWGPPTAISHGDKLFTAFWLKEISGGIIKERLWLTFDNDDQKLRAYRYTRKPFE